MTRAVTVGVLAGDNKPSGRRILPTVDLVQTFAPRRGGDRQRAPVLGDRGENRQLEREPRRAASST
jgi:hypothetical protein